MCPWTRVRLGIWHSCPLLVTSSFTPFWQPMRKWSSCTWTSLEVGWSTQKQQPEQIAPPHDHHDLMPAISIMCPTSFLCVFFTLCRHRIRYHLCVRRPGHCVLQVARAPPLHNHRGRDGLHQCHLPEGSLHHQRPGRGYLLLYLCRRNCRTNCT